MIIISFDYMEFPTDIMSKIKEFNCVKKQNNVFSQSVGDDAGFMCYKFCYCITQEQYFMQREKSFSFGWENYPKQERKRDGDD